jgi:hypothetical protein
MMAGAPAVILANIAVRATTLGAAKACGRAEGPALIAVLRGKDHATFLAWTGRPILFKPQLVASYGG